MLQCNYNEKFLRQINLPHFYKSMLQHFLELKVAYNCATGQDLVLFNNKEILIENQTIFYKEWFQKGIFLVQDFLHENGQLLTFQEFIQRYEVECNFLKYMQVVSAIPKHLLDKAREKQVDKRIFLAENAFQLSPNTTIDLHKMKNRDYYWLLINKDDVEIKATPKWARDLQVVDLNLDTFFNRVKNVCKNNKLKEFYFKLLHRIVVTKKELSFYGMESDMPCLLCKEPDSIRHTFLNCNWPKHFFSEVIKWGNKKNGISFSPSPLEILFSLEQKDSPRVANKSIIKFNHTLLIAKYYLYTQKLL